ncbi:hypothetical protein BDN67DRAFT_491540, partial [Paxillus ammoniavirescens]
RLDLLRYSLAKPSTVTSGNKGDECFCTIEEDYVLDIYNLNNHRQAWFVALPQTTCYSHWTTTQKMSCMVPWPSKFFCCAVAFKQGGPSRHAGLLKCSKIQEGRIW